jgi:hypothetical protein
VGRRDGHLDRMGIKESLEKCSGICLHGRPREIQYE